MKDKIKDNKYFHLCVVLLIVLLVGSCLLAIVTHLPETGRILRKVGDVLSPLVLGIVFAYLMNPLMNFLDRRLKPFLIKRSFRFDHHFSPGPGGTYFLYRKGRPDSVVHMRFTHTADHS